MGFSRGRILALVALAIAVSAATVALRSSPSAVARTRSAAAPRVLRVGTYQGVPGQYSTIQAAVDASQPGDWILVAPGVYHEQDDHAHPPTADQANHGEFGGVVVHTAGVHIRGMDRNSVVVDGTLPHAGPACSSDPAVQDPGVKADDGSNVGRNGIVAYKANNVSVENLTTCNFLSGSGDSGNQIWWNGGDRTGVIFNGGFYGAYLNATTTYYGGEDTAATYGLFSNTISGPGRWDHTYASNFNDSDYYIGACDQVCNQTINDAHGEFSALGYSGTNSGGNLVVQNSEFDNNQDGFDTNSQNNDDYFSPQDGTCPNGATSPITHTHSCWVFMNNYVHDNNNPNVPGAGAASAGPVGTGMTVAGGRNDTITGNRFVNNGAWGILFLPYPDTETPPPLAHCSGGISGPGNLCYFDDWGNSLLNNTFSHNGFFGNQTNSDFGEVTTTSGHPQNCFNGNTAPDGSSPTTLQQTNTVCGQTAAAPDPNPPLLSQVACDSEFFGSCPNSAASNYPRRTSVIMHPLPSNLPSMPDPCSGVPSNPWCGNVGLPSGSPTPNSNGTGGHSCVDRRNFRFTLHHARHARVVKVEVFVNRKRRLVRRGRNITHLTLKRLPQQTFTVVIVATESNGFKLISTRTYRGCRKSPPRTRAVHPHRSRRRRG